MDLQAAFEAVRIRLEFKFLETFMDWGVTRDRISRDRADEILADWAAIAECRIVALGVRP